MCYNNGFWDVISCLRVPKQNTSTKKGRRRSLSLRAIFFDSSRLVIFIHSPPFPTTFASLLFCLLDPDLSKIEQLFSVILSISFQFRTNSLDTNINTCIITGLFRHSLPPSTGFTLFVNLLFGFDFCSDATRSCASLHKR